MFATINIQKIKTDSELEARYNHNRRLGKVSSNVQISQIHRSKHSKHNISDSSQAMFRQVQGNRMKAGANQLRATTVKAVELVLGASGEYFEGKSDAEIYEWGKTQLEWAKEYYKDRGKLLGFDLHLCESNPHIHLIFAPVIKKMDKKTGKVLYTYSAKEFQGTKSEMNRMRSSHAEANEKYGLERGKNYFKEGEKPPEYIDSIKELRRKTAEAEKVYESLSIDDLNDFIRERDETKQFAKEVAEAFANDDKPTLIKVAKKLPPKKKARRKNSRDM
jgi:hypothetical protein